MLLTGFPAAFVRSPECTTWRSLRATNQNRKPSQMREVELALNLRNSGPSRHIDHEFRQACFASLSAVAVAILARFNRFRVNFEVTILKSFPHLAFSQSIHLKKRLKWPSFDGELMAIFPPRSAEHQLSTALVVTAKHSRLPLASRCS